MHFGVQELIVILVLLLILAIPIISAVWVFTDASRRENRNAGLWAVCTFFFWFPVFLIYVIVRRDFRKG